MELMDICPKLGKLRPSLEAYATNVQVHAKVINCQGCLLRLIFHMQLAKRCSSHLYGSGEGLLKMFSRSSDSYALFASAIRLDIHPKSSGGAKWNA